MGDTGICVAWMTAGWVDGRFSSSLFDTMLYDQIYGGGQIWSKIYAESGPRIADTRCGVVKEFLHNRNIGHSLTGRMPEHLVMIDADMAWEADAIHRLVTRAVEEGADVLGGLCFTGSRTEQVPTIYRLEEDSEGHAVPRNIVDYPENAVVKVGATGAAFMAMSRTCLQKMGEQFRDHAYPWFVEGIRGSVQVGEDVGFCLRAQALGFKVAVDTSIKVGHWKRYCFNEDTFKQSREHRYE
jgi:GT2 family glycosyltransferase